MIKIGYNDSTKHYGDLSHYEKPSRVNFCLGILQNDLADEYFIPISNTDTENNISKLIELVKLAHTNQYIEKMKDFKSKSFICRMCGKKNVFGKEKSIPQAIMLKSICSGCDNKLDFSNLYCYASIDTYYTHYTFNIALEAVGVIGNLLDWMSGLDGNGVGVSKVEAETQNQTKYSFALVRPPGHHCNNDPNGFCVFNNVYIGAKYAQKKGFEKVLILDVDFHHGDGTQQLIEASPDPNIFFVSIHGYGDEIYPGTGGISSNNENILNIPLGMNKDKESREYITDDFYQNILDTQVFPFVQASNPNLIVVSLGFDAHQADPLEGMGISDLTYIYLALKLKQLGIPVMFVLEGGYNIKTIARIIPKMISIMEE